MIGILSDPITLIGSFVNLIAFMESSDNRLCSLVSTLLFTDSFQLLHCFGLCRVQVLVGHNSVLSLLSFASRTPFHSSVSRPISACLIICGGIFSSVYYLTGLIFIVHEWMEDNCIMQMLFALGLGSSQSRFPASR